MAAGALLSVSSQQLLEQQLENNPPAFEKRKILLTLSDLYRHKSLWEVSYYIRVQYII